MPASLGNAVRTELAEVGVAAETVLDVPDEAAAETSEAEGSLCELLVAFVIVAEDSANISLLLQTLFFFRLFTVFCICNIARHDC